MIRSNYRKVALEAYKNTCKSQKVEKLTKEEIGVILYVRYQDFAKSDKLEKRQW